jgi:hypothetical protein
MSPVGNLLEIINDCGTLSTLEWRKLHNSVPINTIPESDLQEIMAQRLRDRLERP